MHLQVNKSTTKENTISQETSITTVTFLILFYFQPFLVQSQIGIYFSIFSLSNCFLLNIHLFNYEFLFICFGARVKPYDVQGLLLALHFVIFPGKIQRMKWGIPMIDPTQGKSFIFCTESLAPNYAFLKLALFFQHGVRYT